MASFPVHVKAAVRSATSCSPHSCVLTRINVPIMLNMQLVLDAKLKKLAVKPWKWAASMLLCFCLCQRHAEFVAYNNVWKCGHVRVGKAVMAGSIFWFSLASLLLPLALAGPVRAFCQLHKTLKLSYATTGTIKIYDCKTALLVCLGPLMSDVLQ